MTALPVTPASSVVRVSKGVPVGEMAIGEVSRLLGVPVPTLRSWERRYALPAMDRSDGRHRRYSSRDVHALRLMSAQVAGGKPARDAARDVHILLAHTGPGAQLTQHVLNAAGARDSRQIRAVLENARNMLGLAGCIDEVIVPALQHVEPHQQSVLTSVGGDWLRRIVRTAPPPHRSTIVLVSAPGDAHTIALQALAALLSKDCFSALVLPVGLAPARLAGLLCDIDAAAVVVSCQLSSSRHRAVTILTAARRSGATPFYAGNAFHSVTRRRLDATYLGTRIGTAADIIHTALTADHPVSPSLRPVNTPPQGDVRDRALGPRFYSAPA